MLILAINTAEAACDVALIQHGKILADKQESLLRGQDGRLPGLVEDVLNMAAVQLGDIDRLAVVVGPGSFTGIRIGVAFTRGLALALNVPAIGITSLEAGLPPAMIGPAKAALPAKRRPPDKTWWTQELQMGIGVTPVVEEAEARLPLDDLEPAKPRATWAGLKAADLDPKNHPPSPIYARAPEIHKPKIKD